jgi:hypothetical protein
MQPGDLVVLSSERTRKGMKYEDKVGVVVKVHINSVATVNFSGIEVYYETKDLQVISESR